MKRLLLIAPVFFGYYKDMILEAEELGISCGLFVRCTEQF